MQMEKFRFTQDDLAQHLFLKETAAFMKKLKSGIEKLTEHRMAQILNRAEERIENAILSVSVGEKHINYVNLPLFFLQTTY